MKVTSGVSWRRSRPWLALALALVSWLLIAQGIGTLNTLPGVGVTVRMSTTTAGDGQFFPRDKDGHSEKHAVGFTLADDRAPHEYSATLSGLIPPGAFRLDPGQSPGVVKLHAVTIESGWTTYRLEGGDLSLAVHPLNQLVELIPDGGIAAVDGPSLRSVGNDPFLEIRLPPEASASSRRLGFGLLLTGVAGLLWLLWLSREQLKALSVDGIQQARPPLLLGLTVVLGLALLGALRSGCEGICSPEGIGYGGSLLLASIAMAVVGAAVLHASGLLRGRRGSRLFLWIGLGQIALVIYVFLRSAIHGMIPWLPLSGAELALPVAAAAMYLWRSRRQVAADASGRWLAVEASLLVVVCIAIADRELPRLLMLSSDPDQHAYFARQLQLLGGIPWQGEAVFGYPGGTAAFGFTWAKMSLLDVRNAMTALPLMQSFLAALLLGEAFALQMRAVSSRLLLMVTMLGITAAGFLLPLYSSYSHMEGTGRQLAIATYAVIPALLLSGAARIKDHDLRLALVLLATLFVLGVLNPVNLILPIILVIAYAIHFAMLHRRISWCVAALMACPVLLLMDPYYFHVASGSEVVDKIAISNAMEAKPTLQALREWLQFHLRDPLWFLRASLSILPGQAWPMFALLIAGLWSLRLALRPTASIGRAKWVAGALALVAMLAADGLFMALGNDRRFYLLAPYFAFSIGQLKILLVTALAGSTFLLATSKKVHPSVLAMAAGLVVVATSIGMRSAQPHRLDPRKDHCGSLGCMTADDQEVLHQFEQLATTDRRARVLLPNSVHDTRIESWVFPVAGARAYPFYDVPSAAFFYYQGDDDFTTANYKSHVCDQFDRKWLKIQRVSYVFLPSFRDAACMKDMDRLPETEDVLIQRGNSYLIRLR